MSAAGYHLSFTSAERAQAFVLVGKAEAVYLNGKLTPIRAVLDALELERATGGTVALTINVITTPTVEEQA